MWEPPGCFAQEAMPSCQPELGPPFSEGELSLGGPSKLEEQRSGRHH